MATGDTTMTDTTTANTTMADTTATATGGTTVANTTTAAMGGTTTLHDVGDGWHNDGKRQQVSWSTMSTHPPLQYASSSSGNVTSTIPNSKWRKCEALSIV